MWRAAVELGGGAGRLQQASGEVARVGAWAVNFHKHLELTLWAPTLQGLPRSDEDERL
jgi:hypothetical protein